MVRWRNWIDATLFGGEVKETHTGSSPALTTMSRRYSESSNQDFKNDSAECLRREWDIVGTKESDTPPPSSCWMFLTGKTSRFLRNRKPINLLTYNLEVGK